MIAWPPGVALARLDTVDSTNAEARRRAGCEVLNENIGTADQLRQNVLRLRMLDVERQAFLRTVEPDEVGGLTLDGLVIIAREIADAGSFDLDHARAEVGELAGAERSSHRLFERDDRDAFEWTHADSSESIDYINAGA